MLEKQVCAKYGPNYTGPGYVVAEQRISADGYPGRVSKVRSQVGGALAVVPGRPVRWGFSEGLPSIKIFLREKKTWRVEPAPSVRQSDLWPSGRGASLPSGEP